MRAGPPPATATRGPAEPPCGRERPDLEPGSEPGFDAWLRNLVRDRAAFGITRVGSVTGLDRVRIPVVQAARPLALSNAVTQGKGPTWARATASALMESIEAWAGETIPESRLKRSPFQAAGAAVRALYEPWVSRNAPDGWEREPLAWMSGRDLFTGRTTPVPAALVDTDYTWPSPHPVVFPRTTTGLGAGRSPARAMLHAGLEILERDAIAQARRTPHFFDLW